MRQLRDGNMPIALARRTLELVQRDAGIPWFDRADVVRAVAAAVALYPEDLRRVTTAGRSLVEHLASVCRPTRLEWLFNVSRFVHTLGAEQRELLPSGTTSNEALNAELRSWFESTVRLHRATLRIKLVVFQFAKLLAHNAALYRSTLRQQRQTIVLHRLAGSLRPFTLKQWRELAASPSGEFKRAVRLQQAHMRSVPKRPASVVAKKPAAVLKKPAVAAFKRPAGSTRLPKLQRGEHRTVFRLKRATTGRG